ncbi:uncharacterized protein A1O5_07474 [Cladophialophora psammophila CBS 110553]|uniref:Uncharacterized protein n=1 Tax=Cladophialophora psammophila CBS 110553 TaxID=1182543 RepID=W9WNJ1_9EURO|nr:uncharacterized protein A1O5_07474 [Cladophialophora psammophila CBS 110553]EXJ69438.1 hypothetical protein A1O5_07474 [Cladophialophora psammophila CBS 110553]
MLNALRRSPICLEPNFSIAFSHLLSRIAIGGSLPLRPSQIGFVAQLHEKPATDDQKKAKKRMTEEAAGAIRGLSVAQCGCVMWTPTRLRDLSHDQLKNDGKQHMLQEIAYH